MGYEWHPVFRQTPDNGAIQTVDTRLAFTEIGGPQRLLIGYQLERTAREDINRRARSRVFGFRLQVRMHVYIGEMQDSVHLIDIANRMARDDWSTELSLNGGGGYNEMEIEAFKGPEALSGKTVAGALFELQMRSVEPLPEMPYIAALVTPLATAGGSVLPTASAAYKWVMWTVGDVSGGAAHATYQCLWNGSGWEWIPFVSA